MSSVPHKAGLEDVVAADSRICFIDGVEGRLIYAGYDIVDLAEHSTFEEVVFLLWEGRLPNKDELSKFKDELLDERKALPESMENLLRLFPQDAAPMDVLRTCISFLGTLDDTLDNDQSREANRRRARVLVSMTPVIVAAFERVRQGAPIVPPRQDLDLAGNFLYMLTGKEPDALSSRVMDIALVLHADHELNASTFAARVTAGTLSCIYSAMTSAIGALKGPLHGGANEQVMRMLKEIGEIEKVETWIREALAAKKKIAGFGHRVYRVEDPRSVILKQLAKELGERTGTSKWYEMTRVVERVVFEEKGLYPNVDLYSGSAYYAMGIPIDQFTPIFAISRMSGWLAHVLEQYDNNRLIRPRAEYVGPQPRAYVPLAER